MSTQKRIQHFAGGDVYFWLEQDSSIMLKATSNGDPVELDAEEARAIGEAMIVLARKLDAHDPPGSQRG